MPRSRSWRWMPEHLRRTQGTGRYQSFSRCWPRISPAATKAWSPTTASTAAVIAASVSAKTVKNGSRRSWWRLFRWISIRRSLQAGQNGFEKSMKPIPWPAAASVGNQCGSLPSAPIHLRSRGSLNTSGSSPRVPHSWFQPIPFPHSATSAIWTFNTPNLPGIPTLRRLTFKGLTETWEHRGFFCGFSEESKDM